MLEVGPSNPQPIILTVSVAKPEAFHTVADEQSMECEGLRGPQIFQSGVVATTAVDEFCQVLGPGLRSQHLFSVAVTPSGISCDAGTSYSTGCRVALYCGISPPRSGDPYMSLGWEGQDISYPTTGS